MTELTITSVGDTWANDARPGQNYGSAKWVQLQSGAKRGYVRPHLGSIAGRTVVDAYLTGHSGGTAAQTLTIVPVTERWSPGQLTATSPSTTGATVNSGAAVSVAIGALADGESFDITGMASMLQAIADGTDYHGFRISTSHASTQTFYSTDSGEPAWELHVELSDTPEQPTDLRPDGGAVSSTSPSLAWEFLDLGGEASDQAQSRVQVDKPAVGIDPDEVSPDYDSGWEDNADPQWDLAGEHTISGVGPHFWRVQVKDADGNISEWSDWAEFTYYVGRTIVMDSPTGPFGDPTPTIIAHLSAGTLTKWRAKVTGPDRSDVRARTGLVVQNGGDIEWTLPLREDRLTSTHAGGGVGGMLYHELPAHKVFRGNGPWWLHIRAWDERDRTTGVGIQPYVETWVELSFDDDLGVQVPSGLQVAPIAPGDLRNEWSWDLDEEPDAVVVYIDDEAVERLTSDDWTVDSGRYTWVDSGHIAPLRPQVLSVRAIDGNARSAPVFTEVEPDLLEGVWIVPDDDTIAPIVLAGTGVDEWTRTDFRATYTTSKGEQVDVTYGQPGRAGDFQGSVDSSDEDVWATLARIEALRTSTNRGARLVWASQSIAIRVRDIDATPSSGFLPTNLEHVVRVSFIELDR